MRRCGSAATSVRTRRSRRKCRTRSTRPDGALLYYTLASKPAAEVSLDILDRSGDVIRHMSSSPVTVPPEFEHPPEPNFWLAVPQPLPTNVGGNRVNWNIRYDDPPAFSHSFAISANPGLTPASPEGPLALPGTYTARLTVDGKNYTAPVVVRNDPRSPATMADLVAQHTLQMKIYHGIRDAWNGFQDAESLRNQIVEIQNPAAAAALQAFEAQLDSVAGKNTGGRGGRGGGGFGRGGRGGSAHPTLQAMNGTLVRLLDGLDGGDMAPTPSQLAGFGGACKDLRDGLVRWESLMSKDLPALNATLSTDGVKPLTVPQRTVTIPVC